ncbi:hypothetical protein E2562_034815 [Oryza meyeriana var. granulata]|uniref:AB hydrolase-1 domain-containing protein n=1 Tax=Oryza meyeriana var. granulata TaxID=110450 RepID=A0A6G1E791_9ORYZ|nr:hypothetical protein E2562_034815 [Oryza meyeriana var. granulata]
MGFAVSLLNAIFRRMFTSAGLRPHSAVVDDDGTTLHFWAHRSLLPPSKNGTAASAGSKETTTTPPRPVVVLVHGFGPDPTWQWAAQVGPLSRHFDLVVPALLFFGASTTRAAARSDAFQAAAIAALLAGASHLPGLDGQSRQVHVVGTSYGGLVARHLARALSGKAAVEVGKVVLCNSDLVKGPDDDAALAAKGGVSEVTELMAPADGKTLRRLMALCVHRPPKYIPEFIVHDLLRKYFADKREEKIQLIKGIVTEEDDAQLNSPLPQEVLIIWGEFDQIFPVEKAYKVKEILGEKATVKIIPNTGHLAHQEDPKMFNDILLKFLLPSSVLVNDAK